jgi:glycerol-3-phosphate dehydrogenase (NAD(P)+)
MNSILKNSSNRPVGVIGAGYFGTAIANLLAYNAEVLMYVYSDTALKAMQETRISAEQNLSRKVSLTNSMQKVALECEVIFIIVPSEFFKSYIQQLSPFLEKNHILIHGTKGLEVDYQDLDQFSRKNIRTMSEILSGETNCNKIGLLLTRYQLTPIIFSKNLNNSLAQFPCS